MFVPVPCCFDLRWPWAATAWGCSWVPRQILRLSHGGESTRSQLLEQWSVTRVLALWLCRKEFPQRQKVMKQVKCLLGGNNGTVYVARHTDGLRDIVVESHPPVVWITFMKHSSGNESPITLHWGSPSTSWFILLLKLCTIVWSLWAW